MISVPLVLWAGHFGIGLAYYLRYYIFKTKSEVEKERQEAYEKYDTPLVDFAVKLWENKLLTLVLYLLVGYVNIPLHIKRIIKG